MQILRKAEEMIYPAACSHPALHRLSETDQLRIAVPKLFFYTQGPSSSEALKSSLSKTLALFYPLAGRLTERAAGGEVGPEGTCCVAIGATEEEEGGAWRAVSGGRVDVSCLDQGALFCEAWTDARLDAYMPDFQPHPHFQLLVVPDHNDVLLRVQVTYFACGGMCLSVQAHHGLVDGTSSAQFMECWVEFANGKENITKHPYISHLPLEIVYRPKEASNSYIEEFPMDLHNQGLDVKIDDTSLVLSKMFHFTSKFIDTLKTSVSDENCKYSSFECIMAYMWRNMIIAKGISYDEETCLHYPVNGRGKLEPPLPSSYFGNVVFGTHAIVKVCDLLGKPLSHITQLIRDSSSRVNDEHIRSKLKWFAKQTSPKTSPCRIRSQDFIFTSSTTFPLCDLNFGWGNPTCCRAFPPMNFGVLLSSSSGKRHIEVLISLDEKPMYKLETLISQRLLE